MGGIKDLLILGKTAFFIEEYSKKTYFKARLMQIKELFLKFQDFILNLFQYWISKFYNFTLLQGKDLASLVTILGVFVAATFRMIPSLNRIIAAIKSMKYL